MQKERVMLRAAGGIPYELTRGRVKLTRRVQLPGPSTTFRRHVRRDGIQFIVVAVEHPR